VFCRRLKPRRRCRNRPSMSSPFLAFTEVDRESGGGLILLTASLSGESVRHDWSRECRFFFFQFENKGERVFHPFQFF